MKRTAGAFVLLASLGGCMHADRAMLPAPKGQATPAKAAAKYQGPYGEPITAGNTPGGGMSPGIVRAHYVTGDAPKPGANLVQTMFNGNDGSTFPTFKNSQGIAPVPMMGPPGAVAAVGALPHQMPMMPVNMRTSVRFTSPTDKGVEEDLSGYKVTWFGPNGWNEAPLISPARYNFLQGGVYRLKITSVPNNLDKVYYPTLEVVPGSPKTVTYLAHSSVPIVFTREDFEQVNSGNYLVKVVYLPDPNNQDLATVVGPNELRSTRLEPGQDPIVEASRLGTILLIIRMGNIDLQAPNSPAIDAPNPFMMQPNGPRVLPNPVRPTPVPPIINPPRPTPKVEDKKPATLPITLPN